MNHRKKQKTSQASMEFLLTYGWAIVILVTAVSAMAYFGINPFSKSGLAGLMPDQCYIDTGLSCLDHSVGFVLGEFGDSDKNALDLRLKNNLGFPIKVSRIEIPQYEKIHIINNLVLENGASQPILSIPDITNVDGGGTALEKGERYEIEFTLTVLNTESGLAHTFHGVIKGRVE